MKPATPALTFEQICEQLRRAEELRRMQAAREARVRANQPVNRAHRRRLAHAHETFETAGQRRARRRGLGR